MDNSSTHAFFETVAKAVIIIPVVIVLIALVTLTKPSVSSLSKKPTVTPSPYVMPTVPQQQKGTPVNLEGPLHCTAKNETVSVDASVKQKKIYAEVTKGTTLQKHLLNGDCLYQWESGKTTGKKTCGMTDFINLADSMSRYNMLTTNTLMTLMASLPADDKTKSSVKVDYANLEPVCITTPVEDKTFTIPRNVTFKLAVTPAITPNTDY